MKTESNEVSESNAFAMLLRDQRDGDCLAEASDKLNELVQNIRERMRPGKMTVTFIFTPAAGATIVTITDEIKVTQPKEEKEATTMFTTEDGTLVRNNPAQRELTLREVKSPAQPLKEIAGSDEPLRTAASQ
jgi:hypothetical protein